MDNPWFVLFFFLGFFWSYRRSPEKGFAGWLTVGLFSGIVGIIVFELARTLISLVVALVVLVVLWRSLAGEGMG